MTRREVRENVFKMLFRVEFHEQDTIDEQFVLYKEALDNLTEEEFADIKGKCDLIFSKLSEIDEAINEAAKGWKTTRMSKVDLAIIRLAVYEIKYDDEIPFKVSVNEAVELAKKFGSDESASFVNGVLAKFAC